MALDVAGARRARSTARVARAARASAARRRRAACWPSSTTTWWARCASSRSSAATIRATSRWCRSAAPGPLHGCALAELLGITPRAGAAGARRALRRRAAGRRPQGRVQPHPAQGRRRSTSTRRAAIFAELIAAGRRLARQARRWRRPTASRRRVALMRYHGQGGEVAVGWVDDAAGVEAAFAAAHESLYGFKLDAPIELVTLRVEATGRMPAPQRPPCAPASDRSRKDATPSISPRERPRCRCSIAPPSVPATAWKVRPSSPSSTPRLSWLPAGQARFSPPARSCLTRPS